MKKIKILFCAFLALGLFSCEEEENMDPVGQWELSDPLLNLEDNTIPLNEELPTETFTFNWDPAISSVRYQVRYTVVIDTLGTENYNSPILSKSSANGGKATNVTFTAAEIDLALSYSGYSANEGAEVVMAVIASSIDKQTTDSQEVTITRFATEYLPNQLFISGAATESGSDISSAVALRALTDANGDLTHRFEAYTHLEAGEDFKIYSSRQLPAHVYGGNDGTLEKNGSALQVSESGEYRVTVDLQEETYDLMKIEKLSIVGDVIPGGWGGDAPLEYVGNGVWQNEMYLSVPESGQGGYLFRLNGDWGYLFKRISNTQNKLYMESQAESAGISIEDLTLTAAGNYIVTVTLAGDNYTYELARNQTSTPPSETPDELYLLADGTRFATFEKDGDVFTSGDYLPLQEGITYELNSSEDGTGTSYSLEGLIGETSNPDGDAVTGNVNIIESEEGIGVAKDQAYLLNFDFSTGVLSWKYYNIKLFHWNEDGGWDDRNEFLMTYVHPHQFTTTQELEAGYAMKFNSPWDVQFGADDPQAMTGTMTNNGGSNFQNITTSGIYNVEIEVTSDYSTGTYQFGSE